MARKKKNTNNNQPDYILTPEELKRKLSKEEEAARKEKEAIIGAPVSESEARAMSVASTNKILGTNEQEKAQFKAMESLVKSGTVAKLMFTKKTRGQPEVEDSKESEDANKDVVESLSAIASNIKEVVKSFDKMSAALQSAIDKKNLEEYKLEEQQAEAVPVSKETPTQTGKDGEKSTGDFLSDFFKNPAVIAAFSGLVYLFLPKEIKEKITGFFTGFKEGLEETSGELDTFKTALLVAAGGLATYLGAGLLKSVAEGISTTVSLITKAKTAFGKLGKAGKIAAGIAVAGGAAVAGAAIAAPREETEEGAQARRVDSGTGPEPGYTPTERPGPAGTSTSRADRKKGDLPKSSASGRDSGMKESGGALGSGLRLQSKTGLQLPSGSDADVKKMIIHHEGIRYRPYKDSLGLWTVGVGHLIGDGKTLPPEYDREFTHDEVMQMFEKDYQHHKQAAEKIPGYENVNDKGQGALIDLTFNMGPAWYKKWPNFTRNLKEGDTEGAAESLENSKWYTQVGRRAPTIVSLIRNSGEGGSETQASSSAAPQLASIGGSQKAATLEPPSVSSGMKIASATERNDASMSTGQGSVINNAMNNSRQITDKKGPDAPPPIPSPIADRGALGIGVRHSTSYT